MWLTVWFMLVAVSVEFLIGFGLALLFLKEFRGRGPLTLFFLLPMMVVPAVSGFIFFMLFQVDGPLNRFLAAIVGHDVQIHWLDDPGIVMWSAIMVDIWQWTPLMFLILLSGPRRPARGPDEPGAHPRRELLAQIPLPDAAR